MYAKTTSKLCDEVNEQMINQISGKTKQYLSIDILESLKTGGFPNHELNLKIGCIVKCLRNINGVLRNGARLRVTRLEDNLIVGEVISEGPHKGKEEIVFMVKLISSVTDFPFAFSRRQLPLRHSYCLTIHESQCQTFKRIGLYLTEENQCLTHGQLRFLESHKEQKDLCQ